MKKLLIGASLLVGMSLGAKHPAQPVQFVVLITSYNNEQYVEPNLDSIFCQRSTLPFQTIYVNDGSKDGTKKRVEAYARKHKLDESQLLLINNPVQLGSGIANIYNTVHNLIDDHTVVVCVDGDDYLSFPGVLERLEKEYADPDVWMTYGRFVVYPAGEFWSLCWGYNDEVIRTRSFRKDQNVPSHLKTFKAKLFKHIKKEDLTDPETGNFYAKAWDMAMLFPMLEMCAPKNKDGVNHSRFIEDTVLYIYNFANPIGDFRNSGGRAEQIRLDLLIRAKTPYEPLEKLFDEPEEDSCVASTFSQGNETDLEFVVIVPSYNNEKYARRNLESLINQNTKSRYSIIVVNDCSRDKTGEILEEVKKEQGLSDSFLKIIHNPQRIGALANIYNTVHNHCKDHQIVVHVDGDDALPHNNIIKRLEKEYEDPNVWMTYGQFMFFPCWPPTGRQWGTTYEIPYEDQVNKRIRSLVYVAQHLRTFKAGLFKKIKKEDLMLNGEFYAMNADMATMIPMLEMAAPLTPDSKSRSLFIPDIMYIYNCINPINDHNVDRSLQLSLEEVIRAIPPYEPLETLE